VILHAISYKKEKLPIADDTRPIVQTKPRKTQRNRSHLVLLPDDPSGTIIIISNNNNTNNNNNSYYY
jgi:hypothetical protein